MKKSMALFIVVLSVAFSGLFLGCVTDTTSLKIENGLPQNKLAYYNDSFDKLREDLWDQAGLAYQKQQLQNYKSPDMRIENGQLLIQTQVGSFSKGGLVSKYELKGDFDFQIDCHLDFLKDVGDMDQVMALGVVEKGPVPQANHLVAISLLKKPGEGSGIFSSYRVGMHAIKGKSWLPMGDFHGSLRIIRAGDKISTYYRKEGGRWKKRDTFPAGGGDARIGILLQNFTMLRKSTNATKPVVAKFDNLRINAAQEIIEEEI
jgi:hypothetical protein